MVWDASALLLLLQKEPGWQALGARLPGSSMSSVNFSEVVAKLLDAGADPAGTRAVLEPLPIELHDFTPEQAYRAAELREPTKHLGLSFGDRACLALALAEGSPVLTADRAWLDLDLHLDAGPDQDLEIELAR